MCWVVSRVLDNLTLNGTFSQLDSAHTHPTTRDRGWRFSLGQLLSNRSPNRHAYIHTAHNRCYFFSTVFFPFVFLFCFSPPFHFSSCCTILRSFWQCVQVRWRFCSFVSFQHFAIRWKEKRNRLFLIWSSVGSFHRAEPILLISFPNAINLTNRKREGKMFFFFPPRFSLHPYIYKYIIQVWLSRKEVEWNCSTKKKM